MKHHVPWTSQEFFQQTALDNDGRSLSLTPVTSVCTWHDVCGFGGVLDRCEWNLSVLAATEDSTILSDVYAIAGDPGIVGAPPSLCERVLILNDGIAKTADVQGPHDTNWVSVCLYLRDPLMKHFMMRRALRNRGLGVRTVIAGGQRLQYTIPKKTGASYLYYTDEPSDYGKQVLSEGFVYNPIEFQMNTAFAKAFTIESLGSAKGIKVGQLYIESDYFRAITSLLPEMISQSQDEVIIKRDDEPVLIYDICDSLNLKVKNKEVTVHHIAALTVCEKLEGERTRFDLLRCK